MSFRATLALLASLGFACSSSDRDFDPQTDAGAGGGSSGTGGGDSGTGGGSSGTGGGSSGTGGGSSGAGGGSSGTGGGSSGTGGGSSGTGGAPPLAACAESRIEALGTAVVSATTATDDGAFTLACGTGRADDVAFDWIAPQAGYYTINTAGSSFDTVLGVLPASCDAGAALACNDDDAAQVSSEIVHEFGAGEHVVVVVDGKNGGNGTVSVSVEPVTCPGVDLTEQLLPSAQTTLDGTNTHDGACGGADRREKALRWSAPSAGLYTISAESAELAPALYVESGPRCGGPLLGCNVGGTGNAARVTRWLDAGAPITVIVDAEQGAGAFSLDIERVADACTTRPFDPIYDTVMDTLDFTDPSVLSGSCQPAQYTVIPNGVMPLPEHAFSTRVEGRSFCYFTVEASAPVALYVLDGHQCAGAELACKLSEADGTGQFVEVQLGDITVTEGRDYVIVVESADPFGDSVSYTLTGTCAFI